VARYDLPETVEALFQRHRGEIAAILVEPVPANYGLWVPPREHVQALVRLARENGALVIFDEVISGFRLGLSGACGLYDLQPDLVTAGKVMGGGLPLAAVAGRQPILDCLAPLGDVYQAGTLSGNPLAAAAGCAVLEQLFAEPPYAAFEFGCTAFLQG